MSAPAADEKPRRSRPWLLFAPLLVFSALAGLFALQLLSGRDMETLPSALIGHPAPPTSLPPLEGVGLPGLDPASFRGKVTLVNVWGSWCAPCRDEHPVLMQLAADTRFDITGLNYKDTPEKARAFLDQLGNPFDAIGIDPTGRAAIEWGVYGVPETFLIGRDGTIRFKHVGPITAQSLSAMLMPEIERALAGG